MHSITHLISSTHRITASSKLLPLAHTSGTGTFKRVSNCRQRGSHFHEAVHIHRPKSTTCRSLSIPPRQPHFLFPSSSILLLESLAPLLQSSVSTYPTIKHKIANFQFSKITLKLAEPPSAPNPYPSHSSSAPIRLPAPGTPAHSPAPIYGIHWFPFIPRKTIEGPEGKNLVPLDYVVGFWTICC
ncbi:hypothetical protein BDZ45DRAFT_26320 [Acephala macrosclerotiorum]|nr:hypothetical protein BDZ45DRAFT_26320 [Acephala macrosclerotiorum]